MKLEKKLAVERLKKELHSYLLTKIIYGVIVYKIEFVSQAQYVGLRCSLYRLIPELNSAEFELLYSVTTGSYNYIFGVRSLLGENEKLPAVFEISLKPLSLNFKGKVKELCDSQAVERTIANLKEANKKTVFYFYLYENNDLDADIVLDQLFNFSKFVKKAEAVIELNKSVAFKMSLSRASPCLVFLFNYFKLNDLCFSGEKIIKSVTGELKYTSLAELYENWETVIFDIRKQFPIESQVIDYLKIKEELLKLDVKNLLPHQTKKSS